MEDATQIGTQFQNIATLDHRYRQTYGFLTLVAHLDRWWIFIVTADFGNVTQTEGSAISGANANSAETIERLEVSLHPEWYTVAGCDQDSGRFHGILSRQQGKNGHRINAEGRKFPVRHLDINSFILGANNVNLIDIV